MTDPPTSHLVRPLSSTRDEVRLLIKPRTNGCAIPLADGNGAALPFECTGILVSVGALCLVRGDGE